MAYVIGAPCIDHSDQACVAVCPADSIAADPDIDREFYIDPEGCIECGACETACPNKAISRHDRLPAAWAMFASIDATWFVDPDWARDVVDEMAARLTV